MVYGIKESSRQVDKVITVHEDWEGDVRIECNGIIIGRFESEGDSLMVYSEWLRGEGIELDVRKKKTNP